jgi:CheY-like chemotaxis protein
MLLTARNHRNDFKQLQRNMTKFKLFGFCGQTNTTALPLSSGAAQADAASLASPPLSPKGKQVLIVDDDPVFLKATAMKMQSAGFQVRTAKEGPEAIAALGETPADVVLMDIHFPADVCNGGMASWDGFQMMSWLSGLSAADGARFVVVSDTDSETYRQRAQKLGAVAYFPKPLDHDRLVAVVNEQN